MAEVILVMDLFLIIPVLQVNVGSWLSDLGGHVFKPGQRRAAGVPKRSKQTTSPLYTPLPDI